MRNVGLLFAVLLGACASSTGQAGPSPDTPAPTPAATPAATPAPSPSAPSGPMPATPRRSATPAPAPTPPAVALGGLVSGTLGGDQALEGGCAWLDTPAGRVDVRYPEGYAVAFDPVRLLGPDGEVVATEGEQVTVAGRREPGLLTFCQVGEVFLATTVRAPA